MSSPASFQVEPQTPASVTLDAGEALDQLDFAMIGLSSAVSPAAIAQVAAAAARAACAIAQLPRGQLSPLITERALALCADLRRSRAFDSWPLGADRDISGLPRGAAGAIAHMLLGPAWRLPSTPLLAQVPDAIWGDYAAWLFASPQRFSAAADARRFSDHGGRHLAELTRWVESNLGSPAVRAALQSYLAAIQLLPFTVGSDGLKRHAELHGRILAAASGARRFPTPPTRARADRRLRVAFVGSHPSVIPAWYRSLDAVRFEVTAHVLGGMDETGGGSSDVAIAAILSLLRSDHRGQKCRQLPPVLADQMAELRETGADIIIYAEDLALSGSALGQLAAQRIAPLQIAVAPVGVTTGLASIDLLIAGETTGAVGFSSQFSERLALIPGSGQVVPESTGESGSVAGARAELALPETGCVLLVVTRLAEITVEKMSFWTDLLQRIPHAVLVVQLLQAADIPAGAIELLGAEFDARLQTAGVAVNRGLIVGTPLGTIAELQKVAAAADIYLDAGTFGEPELVLAALARGVPVVVGEGATLRGSLTPALLRSLGLTETITRDASELSDLIVRLADNPADRGAIAIRQRAALEGLPLCHDAMAMAESAGAVLAQAYDELHERGAGRFKKGKPLVIVQEGSDQLETALQIGREALAAGDLRAAIFRAREILRSAPAHVPARCLMGRAYLASEQFLPAIDYLLAAIHTVEDASVWYDLALALRGSRQTKEALQALETSLRLDASRADSWVLLIELAQAAGADDLVQDALTALRTCAPDDLRLRKLEGELRAPTAMAS